MTQYIKKLPPVFQTITEKKFFDATFDQVFSKKDSDLLYGYLGRRVPGLYNPIKDFYVPEPDKDRTWWQLEPTAFARDENQNKTNILFYEDLLNKIDYYRGNTLNQDRLFESEFYSWGPPIDYDMFLNYQNYYWVEDGLPAIQITGVQKSNIVGKDSYTTPPTATPPNFTLSTGMTITLPSDATNPGPFVVENIGNQNCPDNDGIQLVTPSSDLTPGTLFEFLPWDGAITSTGGRIINNEFWDVLHWEVQVAPGGGDYITIERGSQDKNAWSRTNKWFHIDVINAVVKATGTPFPSSATRALRPIIQFVADLQLFDSGSQFRTEIQFGMNHKGVGGPPILLTDLNNKTKNFIDSTYGISIGTGQLFIFFADPSQKANVYTATVNTSTQVVTFAIPALPDPNHNPIVNGDIVLADSDAPVDGAQRGESWFYSGGAWKRTFNNKTKVNQPPKFQLFDHNGVKLQDTTKYPGNNFFGNPIFSYKEDLTPGATVDPVLGFALVHTTLNQISDIVFENNVYIDRVQYTAAKIDIPGYYYYKTCNNNILYNNWNLYDPTGPISGPCSTLPVIKSSKQRVIDKYVVGYGTEFQFKLSVTPYGYPTCPDIVVSVNSQEIKPLSQQVNGYTLTEINEDIYVVLTTYITSLLLNDPTQQPVVQIDTYTPTGLLDPAANGYFEIPQQLEANPTNDEITEISASNLNNQFSSIIKNQTGFTGIAFGGSNNYKDSLKNRSVGTFILQNTAPLLKTMLVSSSEDLDLITAIRFSSDEYTKFKNKFLNTALQLINQGFDPFQYHNNKIIINFWVNQILDIISLAKEFSNAFAYSYMLASGDFNSTETHTILAGTQIQILDNFLDLTDERNTLYVYDDVHNQKLLINGVDYTVTSNVATQKINVTFHFTTSTSVTFNLYKNPTTNYIPSTPTKVGTYKTYLPKIIMDDSYITPSWVIIGHDGSKTIAFGTYNSSTGVFSDYRDALLLELETRIYNKLQTKYRYQYSPSLILEDVKPGYFRNTRYTRQEYLDITESYLNKWTAKNRANYRTNDWAIYSQTATPDEMWKLYNYTKAKVLAIPPNPSHPYVLPGNWKGIFEYYYDTFTPNTHPWEMLGFSGEPDWWRSEYGNPVTNPAGATSEPVWTTSAAGLHNMYQDLQAGIIRQGPRAIIDPVTLFPLAQPTWARPFLLSILPIDGSGNVRSVPTIFNIPVSDPAEPFSGFDDDWVYGDGSPVEQAWMSTSQYRFNVQEFLYLMRPGPYGEWMWDTLGTENSPGTINPTDSLSSKSSINWQYVQNDLYKSTDPNFAWQRVKNQDQYVHAELVDGVILLRSGYQRWISDRILALNKDVTSVFGQKIRTLDVNLANQLGGFTNKDTTNIFIESVSPESKTASLTVPSNNFDVILHQSQPIKTYSYSGIVIRALADGTFAVYGYDLLNSEFISIDRSNKQLIDVSVGGTPAPFQAFEPGATYQAGDIVRYNGVYYESTATQLVRAFNPDAFIKLKGLPTVGGISVTYRPFSLTTYKRYPYGSIIKTVQEVFDLMIGWGAYLQTQGWKFDDVSSETNQISDWLYSGKQFLFWLNSEWAPDASIQLSPLANSATLVVETGYPSDVESITNGVYSILDKYGIAIAPDSTTTDREERSITVAPVDLATGGVYFLTVHATNTEHVLIFDNITSFNDVIYYPLLRERQQRLRFNGFRSNLWYGKKEAAGYLIIDNQLVPNYDTIVNAMRFYYDPNITIDNPSLEDLGRHLIGFTNKDYLDNLLVTDDVQYLFYQGAIRQKGTSQAFEKLFRSTKIQSNEIIEVFEEWALKLSDFGNTVEQVSTEFRLIPEKNAGDVIVARLNYVSSDIGHVREIRIKNAENVYTSVPTLLISDPDATATNAWSMFSPADFYGTGSVVRYDDFRGNPSYYYSLQPQPPGPFNRAKWEPLLETVTARAYAVLDENGRIARVDITNSGSGYLVAPTITIVTDPSGKDELYAVWQGNIVSDPVIDNIVDIDIDDVATWVRRPPEPEISLVFPTTPNINYDMPNAGYVHFNDVRWSSFNVLQTILTWGIPDFNPTINQTVWVAKSFNEDWNVYKLIQPNEGQPPFKFSITEDEIGNLILHVPYTETLSTDFGNQVVIQILDTTTGLVNPETNYSVSIELIPAGSTPVFLTPVLTATSDDLSAVYENGPGNDGIWATLTGTGPLPTINGVNVGINGRVLVKDQIDTFTNGVYTVTSISPNWVMTRSTDFDSSTPVPLSASVKVTQGTLIDTYWELIGQIEKFGSVIVSFEELLTNYNILALDGTPITSTNIGVFEDINVLLEYKTMRFRTTPTLTTYPYISNNDYIWVDDVAKKWAVFKVTLPTTLTPHRVQENLINTALFESAEVFETTTQNEIVVLPVYDPFKDILPGLAKQNLSYISYRDPARYNVTGNDRLFSENVTFARQQVGNLWWDLNDVRYVYYEQPIAVDGTETSFDNLLYRRDRWGQLFPGSTVDIYEWVESSVPPAEYTGSGIPRDVTTYVQIIVINRFTNISQVYYYFWVLNKATKPNKENRTMAAVEVASLLQNPKAQQFSFFSPIQQTNTNNSYIFYNVEEILSYRGNNVQINYRIGEDVNHLHPWVKDRQDQPHTQWMLFREGDAASVVTDQFWNKMVDSLCGYTKVLPDTDEWVNGIAVSGGIVLPVPDPSLSEAEKYGITYRPRQSMFVDIYAARKIFVQAGNELLKHITTRDDNPDWVATVPVSPFWAYQNWYAIGYENVEPTISFTILDEANEAANNNLLSAEDIVEVIDGTSDGRFALYAVTVVSPTFQYLVKVGIQNSAVKLLDTIYTIKNLYELAVQLRIILNALRTIVFVNEFIIDQNELFFSMVNYVLSEQKTPDWVFKTSYIYIKENDIPLTRGPYFIPNQIDNIIAYIMDAKPYHTQIRSYTSAYQTLDTATGSVLERVVAKIAEYVPWDQNGTDQWDQNGTDKWDELFGVSTVTIKDDFPGS